MELLLSTLLGFSIGILGNWLFWRTLTWQRPQIVVASKIAVERDSETGKEIYRFKILNRGNHQVIGIAFNAWVVCLTDRPGGKITKTLQKLPTHNSPTLTLSTVRDADPPWGLVPFVFLRTQPELPIRELLANPDTRILVTLRATDALSGSTVVEQRTFTNSDLIEGQFPLGKSMEIVVNVQAGSPNPAVQGALRDEAAQHP